MKNSYIGIVNKISLHNYESLNVGPEDFIIGNTCVLDGSILGTAMTTFSINSGPSKGECEIYPDTGTEIITEFKLYCKAWQDQVYINTVILIIFKWWYMPNLGFHSLDFFMT